MTKDNVLFLVALIACGALILAFATSEPSNVGVVNTSVKTMFHKSHISGSGGTSYIEDSKASTSTTTTKE